MVLNPQGADSWFEHGLERLDQGLLDQAEAAFRRTLAIDSRHLKARVNLGVALQQAGKDDEAAQCYRDALAADSSLAQAWFNLGTLLLDRRRAVEAIDHFRKALALDSSRAGWHAALGSALDLAGQPVAAIESLQASVRLDPANAVAQLHFGSCLLNAGDADAAAEAFRRAQELAPTMQEAFSNMLLALNYLPGQNPERIYTEHVAWARRLEGEPRTLEYRNDRDPERRLRIGYLSADFRSLALRYFVEPVLACHDRSRIEAVCYSDALAVDPFSWRLKARHAVWRSVAHLNHDQLAERIREDRIDVLVDLAGHGAGGGRLALFARKPAPVQVSWLGYPATTGLVEMDYRITDSHVCPEGLERYYTERLARMSGSQWCFRPDYEAPEVESPPARRRGVVTFGSIHDLAAVTPRVIALWARLLRQIPGSRLVMAAAGADRLGARIADRFQAHGVDGERVELIARAALDPCLPLHQQIDINLDSFPYSGTASTLHSLWMGVPVVTLRGEAAAARSGAAILGVLGLEELVAGSEEDYANIAVSLASDFDRLESMRRELRQRLEQSPLLAAERFTLELETAYRHMWRAWCQRMPARGMHVESVRHDLPNAAVTSSGTMPGTRSGLETRVVVDGVFFQDYNTGIARVWRTLLQEWVKSGFATQVLLLDRADTAPRMSGIRRRVVPRHAYAKLAEDRAMLQRVCDEERASIFISTYYSTPLEAPAAMMVYDMIPEALNMDLSEPEWREKEHCIRRARRYVAISRNTASDLYRFFPVVSADRITVAYPGLDPVFRPAGAGEIESFKSRFGITKPYFLLVGARDSYKNAIAFFRALARLPDRSRYGVVCVGGESDLEPEQRAACAGNELHLLRLGDDDLRLAFGGAIALVYPTVYEGFGMPVVEAMGSGCPVITTPFSSLPEVAGDAAFIVNPYDEVAFADALLKIQEPQLRGGLSASGLKRARMFSWTRTAEIVASVLTEGVTDQASARASNRT